MNGPARNADKLEGIAGPERAGKGDQDARWRRGIYLRGFAGRAERAAAYGTESRRFNSLASNGKAKKVSRSQAIKRSKTNQSTIKAIKAKKVNHSQAKNNPKPTNHQNDK